MCGIIGYVGRKPCAEKILSGLEKLEYRGYDSAGIALLEGENLKLFKEAGRLSALEKVVEEAGKQSATIGIGHTRWATHGSANRVNAHPHTGNSGRFALVHNGIIENYAELREELLQKGYSFQSETDTEVIAVLLEDLACESLLETIRRVQYRLKGSYALAILSVEQPQELYAVRNASPILVGNGNGWGIIASDAAPLLQETRELFVLEDGEIARVTETETTIWNAQGERITKEKTIFCWEERDTEKGEYSHFMRKEIQEQPEAIRETIEFFESATPCWKDWGKMERVILVACGSAYHVGVAGKYVLEKLLRIPTEVEVASEFRSREPVLNERTLCIVISQSGETADTLMALRKAKRRGAQTISIVNVPESTIARESQNVLYTKAGPEIAVATTKAYVAQLALLVRFAVDWAETRGTWSAKECQKLRNDFAQIPGQIYHVLRLEEAVQNAAKILCEEWKHKTVFFLGRNLDYASALEGALKLKEVSYLHAEAYPAGEMKHGPISLIEEHTAVVAVLCQEKVAEKMRSNLKEVRARGAKIIGIVSETCAEFVRDDCDLLFVVPQTNLLLTPLVSAIPMQLLSYHVAKLLGCDIDKPRNLAKSVTVE